jgi:hypothetical protein
MGTSSLPTLRIPLILVALADLALLGMRLWPWQDVVNLPLNGATGIDPAVCLLTYAGLIFWIGNTRSAETKRVLSMGAMLGLVGGLLLAGRVAYNAQPGIANAAQAGTVSKGLLLAAALVWGIAGFRGAKSGGDAASGMLSALWSAMTSGLLACAAVLVEMYLAAPVPETTDPWKLYEGLAIGNSATQALVQSLNTATGFLLLCPLAGGVLGLVFGLAGQNGKE